MVRARAGRGAALGFLGWILCALSPGGWSPLVSGDPELAAGIAAYEQHVGQLAALARERGLHRDPSFRIRGETLDDEALVQFLMQREIDAALTPEGIAAYFREHRQGILAAGEVQIAHILIKLRDEALAVTRQARTGKDFATLARRHSRAPSRDNGGQLPWLELGRYGAEMREAVAKLRPGEVAADPVATRTGYHVVKLLGRRDRVPTLEEAEPQIHALIAEEVEQRLIREARQRPQKSPG